MGLLCFVESVQVCPIEILSDVSISISDSMMTFSISLFEKKRGVSKFTCDGARVKTWIHWIQQKELTLPYMYQITKQSGYEKHRGVHVNCFRFHPSLLYL